jgi:hypothetical protein
VRMAAGAIASGTGVLDSLDHVVVAIHVGVAPDLSPDRAAVAAQCSSDLRIVLAWPSQGRQHISLSRSDLVVRHDAFPFLAGSEKPRLCQITSSAPKMVAVSL